jgi:hypothetical protein
MLNLVLGLNVVLLTTLPHELTDPSRWVVWPALLAALGAGLPAAPVAAPSPARSGKRGCRHFGLAEISTVSQLVAGSMSTRSAFTSNVNGIASTAPKGPISQVQNTRDRNVSVVARSTTSPTPSAG